MRRGPYFECGITLGSEQLLGSSPSAAVVVRSIVAYSDGIRLTLSLHTRRPLGDDWNDLVDGRGAGSLRISYGYPADGRARFHAPTATPDDTETPAELLLAGGGDGDFAECTVALWIAPRRPGTFRVATRWPDEDIAEAHHDYTVPTDDECAEKIVPIYR